MKARKTWTPWALASMLALWIGCLVPQDAASGELPGSGDPALQAAIDVWLQDNDEESLPVIASLAAAGNIAARLLLARIENTDRAPTDYVDGLSRKERVELFRSDAGKGMLSTHLGVCVAKGPTGNMVDKYPQAFGNDVLPHGTAIIFTAEDDDDEVHRRVERISGGNYDKIRDRLIIVPMPSA